MFLRAIIMVMLLAGLAFSEVAFADTSGVPSGGTSGTPPAGTQGTPSAGSQSLVNPIRATDIVEFIYDVIEVILVFATPIIVLYIMYAGFLFVTARGNDSQISEARTALTWAVIGGVIILGAKIILEIIKNTVTAF